MRQFHKTAIPACARGPPPPPPKKVTTCIFLINIGDRVLTSCPSSTMGIFLVNASGPPHPPPPAKWNISTFLF